jgi:hypothetical protein
VAKKERKRFGLLDPEYNYLLNPYPELRFTKCPVCEGKTGQRKLPLVVHVDPQNLINLNYTHRYCRRCNTLIGHKHEIEQFLFNLFSQHNPEVIGNSYVIIGTMEVKAWREGLNKQQSISEARAHIHDLKTYEELRMTMGGWFHKDQEPPVMEPAPSTIWVKKRTV